MNELATETKMTTKEVAEFFKTTKDVVLSNAKKCLPNKDIEHGKATYWSKAEITVLLDYMQQHTSNNRGVEFNSTVQNTSTDLTPALKIKKAFDLMQEGYQEELDRLKAENERQAQLLIEQKPKAEFYDCVTGSKDTIDMAEVAKVLNCGLGRNRLFELLRNKHILNNQNQPYQKYVDMGYFRIIESKFTQSDGTIRINLKTVVFQKGLDFIRHLITKEAQNGNK